MSKLVPSSGQILIGSEHSRARNVLGMTIIEHLSHRRLMPTPYWTVYGEAPHHPQGGIGD